MRAILIDVIDPSTTKEKAEKRLEELKSLMSTYGGLSPVSIIQKKSLPDYDTYIGKGKVQEIAALAEQHEASILIVNNLLKPRQIYNLNEALKDQKIETWDRVDLILKIFSKHAQTSEAKLQIELASIRHMGPRIFDMGRELMQQTGAVGLRGGQGETNTEMMKRHLKTQELAIKKKLAHFDQVRSGHREQRRRKGLKTAALVGYTNAGKSALLNALTNKGAYSANELFATLDTRIGKLYVPGQISDDGQYQKGQEILISDTIGFIQDLPPALIQAFKSTLAETIEADLLLHVIDIADPEIHEKIQVVNDILIDLGLSDKPQLYIFNKLDLIAHENVFETPIQRTQGIDEPQGNKSRLPETYESIRRERSDEVDAEDLDSLRPQYSLMKAGPETAISLGWIDHQIKNASARTHMKSLLETYPEKSPLFISAESGLGLDRLIGELGGLVWTSP